MPTEANQIKDAETINLFKQAMRKLLRRMFEDKRLAYLLLGTETYRQLLEACASSCDVVLPEGAELLPIDEVWAVLFPPRQPEATPG